MSRERVLPGFARTVPREQEAKMFMESSFNLGSALKAANDGKTHEWVQAYLRTGAWTNLGLADGLLLAPRWWLGPFQAPLNSFYRKCGPEVEMEYRIPLISWNSRIETMASSIKSLDDLPPLIAERKEDKWFLADGNHRHEALRRSGYTSCWALAWLNSEPDFERLRAQL